MAGAAAVGTRAWIQRRLQRDTAHDLHEVLGAFERAPRAPLSEVGFFSPYQVRTEVGVVETGGPERANCKFVEDDTGLMIDVSIHTCRPRVLNAVQRSGELNLVDGSHQDLCTSGGRISIVDREAEEEFQIVFKLIGAPNGSIGWNARQFASPRIDGESWQELLTRLHSNLQEAELPELPVTAQEVRDRIETYDTSEPPSRLMHGERDQMLKMLMFRSVFRRF